MELIHGLIKRFSCRNRCGGLEIDFVVSSLGSKSEKEFSLYGFKTSCGVRFIEI